MASHVIEFEGMQLYAPILYVLVFLFFFSLLLFQRRRAIVKRSGGPFFFGKSKRNEELVEKLKRNAGRYGFKVHDLG